MGDLPTAMADENVLGRMQTRARPPMTDGLTKA